MPFAEKTRVPISQSKTEIEKLVNKYKATSFVVMTEPNAAKVGFQMNDRNILFKISVPENEQKARSRWRALLLVIKAKLESHDAGIETFEDAFLANIVMPNGQTVGEMSKPVIADHYSGNSHVPLLPHYE